jgi:cell wall-associated NlpC family hydrolase
VAIGVCPELHIPSWWEKGVDILNDNFQSQDLIRLPPGTPRQNGDIFFMQLASQVPDHCAVYIGDGMILHHQMDRLSCKAIYGDVRKAHYAPFETQGFNVREDNE